RKQRDFRVVKARPGTGGPFAGSLDSERRDASGLPGGVARTPPRIVRGPAARDDLARRFLDDQRLSTNAGRRLHVERQPSWIPPDDGILTKRVPSWRYRAVVWQSILGTDQHRILRLDRRTSGRSCRRLARTDRRIQRRVER